MTKNNFNYLFLLMSIMSTLFLISTISWLNMWIWLEINLISFIAYLINNKNKLIMESSLIYFLIQSIASIILLFSIIMMMFINNFFFFMIISIMIKLGSAPFHYWILLIIESMDWMKIFFLLTFQKISPLMMLMYNNSMNFLFLFILFSLFIGSISGLNFSSLKKMISFSSINQLSWLMMSIFYNKIFKIYLLIYFFIMISISKMLYYFNIKFINQIYNLNKNLKYYLIFMFLNFFSLGGLPPFLGFFPKMMLLSMLSNKIIILLMILFSLIPLYMYIRIIFSFIMLNSMKINKINYLKNKNKIKFNLKINILNNLILMIMYFII